uniref:Zn(2)-C6 fungal-type domain-containing protein n=1 Tax=Kwoniella dejecticola CBS 10117 TaxID=1296121 RepID=A0A1A6AHE1_9TREE|nr:uncharacterized protein I303_01306 [Kwoniella dejecticola CBS 10117]OBR89479.1 hypothetical protein I303_01306 [Kwoniella dejecticola CBS 10117]
MPRVASVSPHVARRPSPSITGAPQHVFVVSKNIAGPSQGQHQNTDAQTNVASVVEALNKRQPPSCDACRTRKLKCAGRPTVIELGLEATAVIPCEHCREWSLDCSYLYQRKRRGRKNRVVERLAEEQRARRQSQGGDAWAPGQVRPGTGGASSDSEEDSSERRESFNDGAGTRRDSFNGPPRRDSFHHPPQPPSSSTSHSHSFSYPAPHASHNPTIPPHQIHSHSNSHSYGGGPSSNTGPASLPSVASQDFVNSAPAPGAAGVNSTSPNNEVSPSVALSEASVPPSTSIESVLPREMAMNTIRLWFDHVHCIIPVIHRPSFMIDLSTHEEERRPMFFALIMGMIATTLIHVPKSYFGMSAENVRKLSDKCLKACYAVIRREMDNPNLELICIKYMIFIIHNKHGNVGLEAAAFGEAQYLAISLGLHREDTYYGLDPIESERRRRAWFLIYNADKFEAVARAKPVLLRPDEFLGPEATNFPTELDDKSITKQGYLPNSIPVPLISGFNILTRIVTILGDILVHERDIRRRPPKDPEELLSALRQVRQLQHRVKVIADKLPRPFQLEVGSGDIIPAPGWEEAIRDELDLFFSDPMSSETAKDGYLVLKANIHVTLAMTRLRLILHREDLLNRSGQVGTPSRNAAELVAADLGENVDWRHTVYQDLFKAVHGIPIQALAANGPSLVTKIRVVAVTLLDAMPSQEQADPNVQGIAAYLLDFLNIMSSIESQFAD